MSELGKALLGIGLLLVVVGGLLMFASRMGVPLGRLPGDFIHRGRNVTVFIPLGTSILLSVLFSALLYILSRFHR